MEVGQGMAAGDCAVDGVTDDDGVVASIENSVELALDQRYDIVENGHAGIADVVGDVMEAIAASALEVIREFLLMLAQDVDAEGLAMLDRGESFRASVHANEELRRFE